ncbi:hypothetical protein RHS04_03372 [Rhizoctonia solani]|uniref:Uncharacterized protein n=1 Tax=Rhizoctonia solani TaxID=456999 RepID=A0A8H7HB60_9AGAM|nr:hypothetical protein RHS04_03372 [Rhizoctonia solani]
MSISIFLLLELCSLVAALPAGGSGGTRGGSSGGTRGSGGSSGGSSGSSSGGSSSSSGGSSSTGGGKKGSGWTSSRNNGSRSSSGPLSKTAKIILAVIGGIILLVILFVLFKILRDRYRKRKETKYSPPPEKATSSSSPSLSSARSSIEHPATLSHNPGHTQAAVHPTPHPTTNAELTSAVMAGEGSRAGHGESGAGSGSRGGVGPVQWESRALAAISKGMSTNNVNQPSQGVPPSSTTEAIKVRPSPHALLGRQY